MKLRPVPSGDRSVILELRLVPSGDRGVILKLRLVPSGDRSFFLKLRPVPSGDRGVILKLHLVPSGDRGVILKLRLVPSGDGDVILKLAPIPSGDGSVPEKYVLRWIGDFIVSTHVLSLRRANIDGDLKIAGHMEGKAHARTRHHYILAIGSSINGYRRPTRRGRCRRTDHRRKRR